MKLKNAEIKLRDHEDYTEIVSPKNDQYMYMYSIIMWPALGKGDLSRKNQIAS